MPCRSTSACTTQPLLSDALAPTLYGLGNSLQEWAVAVLDHCEGEELIVVGSSVGGSCALEIARASPGQVRGIVLVGAKASVRRDPVARELIVRALQDDGIHAAWDRYWAPLFSSTADAETLAAARRLALEQDVDDLIRGVRALHDRRDQTEFVSAWAGHWSSSAALGIGRQRQPPLQPVLGEDGMSTWLSKTVATTSPRKT